MRLKTVKEAALGPTDNEGGERETLDWQRNVVEARRAGQKHHRKNQICGFQIAHCERNNFWKLRDKFEWVNAEMIDDGGMY
jgi:hypothetical protein